MSLSGTYELVKNEGHLEHMIAGGVPEETAKKSLAQKTLKLSIKGDEVVIDRGDGRTPPTYILNQEVEETMPNGRAVKTKLALNGNVLSIESNDSEGIWKREYSLEGSELTVVSNHSKPGVPTGKRIYKKI